MTDSVKPQALPGQPSIRIAPAQRHNPGRPCPVCDGHSRLPKGRGIRCYGFISADGRFAHCTRTEFAGQLQETGAGTFGHRLNGQCKCGQPHGSVSVPISRTKPVLDSERSDAALRIWAGTRSASGTIVETYLRKRGLTLPIPPTLRFAFTRHGPSGRDLPAMIAAVQRWPNVEPVAVHRTYLAGDGSGKAEVPEPKLSYGPIRGAAIRLAPPGERILIAEGIETALSGQQESGIAAWSTISASNMPNVVLPELPLASAVIIAADNDAAGISWARRAAARWTQEGRKVRIAVPPEGADLNDVLRGKTQ
ncbi:MAG: hypothetical protein EXR54_09305 [Dehalococcoidia bacterium]|nr:hypothetical protein [Dehalococcoidia bacterium]